MVAERDTPRVITDSSALIGLERIGRLDLLPAIFSRIAAPPAVVEEFGSRPDWLAVESVRLPVTLTTLRDRLDLGEAEAIALALEHPGCALLIDEKRGRREAARFGLEIIGTFGVLLLAKQRGLIDAVKPLLDALVAADFRVAEALYQRVLELAEEAA